MLKKTGNVGKRVLKDDRKDGIGFAGIFYCKRPAINNQVLAGVLGVMNGMCCIANYLGVNQRWIPALYYLMVMGYAKNEI